MKYILTGALAALFSMSVVAFADDLTDRKSAMKTLNGSLKTLNGQKRDFNGSIVAAEAGKALAALQKAQKLFAEKGTGETKALDSVWTDIEGFSEAFEDSIAAAKTLKSIGENGQEDMFGGGFNDLAQSCSGCHRKFRARR